MRRTVVTWSWVALLAVAPAASAAITGFAGGTAAPGATLGPYLMTPFAPDGRPLYTDVASVPTPIGGYLGFSIPLEHDRIGDGWMTWSHGYPGDVYYTNGSSEVTLLLPTGTRAFYFYAEPEPYTSWTLVATAQDGTLVSQTITGDAGAGYYGFYSTDGTDLDSIALTTPQPVDFAVGEFGIAPAGAMIPAPSGLLLALIGTGLVARWRQLRVR